VAANKMKFWPCPKKCCLIIHDIRRSFPVAQVNQGPLVRTLNEDDVLGHIEIQAAGPKYQIMRHSSLLKKSSSYENFLP
jgi:hypothetical protein